jgi:hypothetical protein
MNVKNVLVLLCVAAMSSGAFAWTMLGPATAELDPGQWSAGYSYTYAETDLDFSVFGFSTTLSDAEINRHYLDLGYGVAENWELSLLLGVAGTEADDIAFDGSNDFSWGFNTKYTFIDDETIDWGVMYQMTWFNPEDGGIEIDGYDVQIAAGPTIDMGGWDLYCGAWYYMLDADVEAFGIGLGSLEEEDNFGGHVGAGFEIMENTDLNVEYAFSSDSMGLGASIVFSF